MRDKCERRLDYSSSEQTEIIKEGSRLRRTRSSRTQSNRVEEQSEVDALGTVENSQKNRLFLDMPIHCPGKLRN